MSWSWKIGRVAGIPIFIHWTFLILIAYILIAQVAGGEGLLPALQSVAFVLALFGCVVLHELGHALTAKRFGVETSDITLLPIGGVARLQRIPEKPSQELAVALAGPMVNVVIVILLWMIGVRPVVNVAEPNHLIVANFWPKLMEVNLFLAVFNMLPAFPMDGGRVLRALLALKIDYARATRMAASIGQLMAIGFGFLGLSVGNPILLLIALFVWIGAESEASQVEERVVLRGVLVREAMLTEFHTLLSTDTLGQAADLLISGTQHDFPVLEGHRFAGILTRSDMMNGLSQGGPEALVSAFVKPEPISVSADSPLVPAMNTLRESGLPCLRVIQGDETVGLLTLENVGEYVMVKAALAASHASPVASKAVR